MEFIWQLELPYKMSMHDAGDEEINQLVRELNMFEVDTIIQEGSDSEQGKSSSSDSRARIGSKISLVLSHK